MSRMFKSVTETWNVFIGCRFDCSYCNAKKAAETRFRHVTRYVDGFTPKLIESELRRCFKPGDFIFVTYMGDIAWATREQVRIILDRIQQFPKTSFLIQSKNPRQFYLWQFQGITIPPNVVLGTTLETNRDYGLSKAPAPLVRYLEFSQIRHIRKFVSIEPIMDFDLDDFSFMLGNLHPDIIEVGADNYHNHLTEPPWSKIQALLENLRRVCPRVEEKQGLERLKGVSRRQGENLAQRVSREGRENHEQRVSQE